MDKGELPLQLGQQAGLVVAAAVELTPQAVGDGGAGHVLLAGGDEGVDALLQGRVGADSQTALADEGVAVLRGAGGEVPPLPHRLDAPADLLAVGRVEEQPAEEADGKLDKAGDVGGHHIGLGDGHLKQGV